MPDVRVEAAERQLDRVHAQFSRIEAKSSLLLATNVGLLALSFYNIDYKDFSTWYVMVPFVCAVGLVAFSIYDLYAAAFPRLEGGHESLVYFSSIAAMTEANYLERCSDRTTDQHL